jgi:hypothetical protein
MPTKKIKTPLGKFHKQAPEALNEILDFPYTKGTFYISYNPGTKVTGDPLGKGFEQLGSKFGLDDRGESETAVYYKGDYYILHGDWRKQYSKVKTPEEALEVYYKNIKHKSNWSSK